MGKQMRFRWKVLSELYPYARDMKRYWCIWLLFSAATVVLEFITPVLYKIFINDVILMADLSKMKGVIVGYLLLHCAGVMVGYIKICSKYHVTNTFLYRVRKKILNNYFQIPFADYENISVGDLKMRMDEDTEQVNEFLGDQTVDYLISCIMIVISTLILMSINWVLTIYSIIAIPLTFWLDRLIGAREKDILDERRDNQQAMSSWLHASVQGWREVKALNLARRETRYYYHYLHKEMLGFAKWINYWTARVLIIPKIKDEFFMQFGLYLLGGLFIIFGRLSIGELLVFAVYYSILSDSVQSVSVADADFQSKMPYIERLMESLNDVGSKIEGGIVPDDSQVIMLKDVSFAYQDAENPVISNLNLVIEKGERVAITGKSGSGKTTLLKLITGMLLPTKGQVSFSGVDLKQIDIAAMHSKIGFVMQENILFHTSIRENLLYAKRDATDEEMVAVCKQACIYDFIAELPQGLDTLIGEKGIKLSGGQRQRIVLARMFLQDVDVFIFDEATSALDQYSESIVHDTINHIARDKTIIVVAHRESSIKLCDRIVEIG